jgi:hypothetical protein
MGPARTVARASLLLLALPLVTGCLNWSETWTNAAYAECGRIPNTDDRRACAAAVDQQIRDRAQDRPAIHP